MKTSDTGKTALASERGIALVAVLLIMVMLAFLGAAVVFTGSTELKIARNTAGSTQAFMLAEAGLSQAIDYIRNDPTWGPDLDDDGQTSDDAATWAAQNQGSLSLGGGQSGSYTVTVYDNDGNYGRTQNVSGHNNNPYVTLTDSDILIESTGTVAGVTRKVGLVIRYNISAFDYATYSQGEFDGTGSGNNPGKFVGKMYGGEGIQLQGNYNVTDAIASSPGNITPNCNSAVWTPGTCTEDVEEVEAPMLDFAFYQDQDNFDTQQVFTMTPGVGSTSSCGVNCTSWPVTFQVTTLGTSYTITSRIDAVKQTSGPNKDYYLHTVYWCSDKTWTGTGNCPGGSTPNTYSFYPDSKNKIESSKPFVNATQFNSYTTATGAGYTSSVVNVFDATKHLEFLGPGTGNTATVTASILVGTAANNTEPIGKIDFEGGNGTINFQPENGLAVVAEKVVFNAKYGNVTANVGTAEAGAVVIATKEFEVKASGSYTANVTINGSVVVGDNTAGDDGDMGEFEISGNGVVANFNYVSVENLPEGWQNYGSMTIERREWREL
jgi:hypothetical protein